MVFKIIKILNSKSGLSIKILCKIANVSTSGYYAWINKQISEEEQVIINLIKEEYWKIEWKSLSKFSKWL